MRLYSLLWSSGLSSWKYPTRRRRIGVCLDVECRSPTEDTPSSSSWFDLIRKQNKRETVNKCMPTWPLRRKVRYLASICWLPRKLSCCKEIITVCSKWPCHSSKAIPVSQPQRHNLVHRSAFSKYIFSRASYSSGAFWGTWLTRYFQASYSQ